MELIDVTFLQIYTGEDVLCNDEPLYKAIAKKSSELNLAGITVTKALSGYARTRRDEKTAFSKFFSGNTNSPIIIQIIDKQENIAKILPFLEAHANHSCVTLSPCKVLLTDYLKKKFSQ